MTFLRTTLILIFSAYLSACVSPGQIVTDITPEKISANAKVGVIWLSSCSGVSKCGKSGEISNQAQFVPDGASGLIILGAILSAHEEIREALKSVTEDSIVNQEYLEPVASALAEAGSSPLVQSSYHYFGNLQKKERHKLIKLKSTLKELYPEKNRLFFGFGFEHNLDLSAIASEMGVDVLAVLHVQEFGIRRDFGPLGVPLGNPYALSLVRLYMTDVATGELLFNDFGVAEESLAEGWRQPNDWSIVKNATASALEQAIERVTTVFVKSFAASS